MPGRQGRARPARRPLRLRQGHRLLQTGLMPRAPTGERPELMETRRDHPEKRVKQAVAERARMRQVRAMAPEAGAATGLGAAQGAGRERARVRATEPLRESLSRVEAGGRMVQAPALCLARRIMWRKCRSNPRVLTA